MSNNPVDQIENLVDQWTARDRNKISPPPIGSSDLSGSHVEGPGPWSGSPSPPTQRAALGKSAETSPPPRKRFALALAALGGIVGGFVLVVLLATSGGKSSAEVPTGQPEPAADAKPLASMPTNSDWQAWRQIEQRFGPKSATAAFLQRLEIVRQWKPSSFWTIQASGTETNTNLLSMRGGYLARLSLHTLGDGGKLSRVHIQMDNAKLASLRLGNPDLDSDLIVGWMTVATFAGGEDKEETARLARLLLCLPSRVPPGKMQDALAVWLQVLPQRVQGHFLAACDDIEKDGGGVPQNIPAVGFPFGKDHVIDLVFGCGGRALDDEWQIVISDAQCEEFTSRGSTGWPRLKAAEVDKLPLPTDADETLKTIKSILRAK